MNDYKDHLFKPRASVNEVSLNFMKKFVNKWNDDTSSKHRSAMNAFAHRNAMMKQAGSKDVRDPRWSMLTRYGSAQQRNVDDRHNRAKGVVEKIKNFAYDRKGVNYYKPSHQAISI